MHCTAKLIAAFLITVTLSGCFRNAGRVIVSNDNFRKETTVKLSQFIKGYRPDDRYFLIDRHDYMVRMYHFSRTLTSGKVLNSLDVIQNYIISPYTPDSILYISLDEEVIKLTAMQIQKKLHLKSSSSSSTESKTEVEKDSESDSSKTTTSNTSSSSAYANTYEMVMHSFTIPDDLVIRLAKSNSISFRLYIGNQPIDIKPSRLELKRMTSYYQILEQRLSE